MIQYDLDFIYTFYNDISNCKVDTNIDVILNTILSDIDVSLNEYILKKENKNKFNKYKNDRYKYNDFNNKIPYIAIPMPKKKYKSNYEEITNNMKKLLNKLSINNYDKMIIEFIELYSKTYNPPDYDINDIENREDIQYNEYIKNLKNVNLFILENIVYTNLIYSDLYVKLFLELIKINKNIVEELSGYKNIFNEICNYIKFVLKEDSNNDDIVIMVNKNNDKYKSLCIFIINCYKNKLIDNDFIHKSLINFLDLLITNLKLDNHRSLCEEITGFANIIFVELFKDISCFEKLNDNDNDNDILEKIEFITKINKDEFHMYPSVSNKIKFKFMDIHDNYQKQFKKLINNITSG